MLFSQRKGYKQIKELIQKESMDDELRISLWNLLHNAIWGQVTVGNYFIYERANPDIASLVRSIWSIYFKKPLDLLNDNWRQTFQIIRNYFFECPWYEVYDFVEFVVKNYKNNTDAQVIIKVANVIFTKELSAYRFVNGEITEITSEEEISSIETATKHNSKYSPVTVHLNTALQLLADRKNPDYRNSIKESISAVESLCMILTENPKATLGQALKIIEERMGLHPALRISFSSLYGYTSDAEGIRHALLSEPDLTFDDAKYMLISCSAFTNYLISKTDK